MNTETKMTDERALEGMVLVPKKPTLEMCRAVLEEMSFCSPVDIYRKMLAAAPKPTAGESAPEPMTEGDKTAAQSRMIDELTAPAAVDGEMVERFKVSFANHSFADTYEDRLRIALIDAFTGEEIMVNAAHGVFTLPLQPSGLSSGPRFVVHVPAPESEQPAAVGEISDADIKWDMRHIEPHLKDEEAAIPVLLQGVRKVIKRALAQQYVAMHEAAPNSAVAAIQFALSDPEGMPFLQLWSEGEFDAIRSEWPDAPAEVYIDADPGQHQETKS